MSQFTILGAGGTVGRALAAHLRASGENVFAPMRGDDAIWREDLGRVIYCIGVTADFRTRPLETIEAHVTVLHRLLAEARFERLVYLSSTRVYGGAGGDDAPAREDRALSVDPHSGSDLYNLSKLMGESLCLHGSKGRACVARLSNVVGGEDGHSENFLPSLLREARAGHMHLRSALDSAKDYIHIEDAVAVLAALAKGSSQGIYNVASGIRTAHSEWIAAIQATTGASLSVEANAPRILFPPIDITRIRTECSAQPRSPVVSIFPDFRAAPSRGQKSACN
ncbi:MAG: SDR family oxidoreductase [Methylobacterium sp.]|jgi:nucleoside-diphosphate-sugar epimerase|nr:SDR family oxidoreductase [Methylobacterium sp.]